ncbi:hypothetical protein K457DRAFT_1871652 [Linnemannia elongata AG-77]|uniref:Uncharacterized protein n=1 Tax=Linnemannia elongata AG-77 TaxID=1314771 RepID=A0A197K856_9FUNG|nr:hypothetical protein K457DRAFT_1871652 [Linnemannia elongata AG-77]
MPKFTAETVAAKQPGTFRNSTNQIRFVTLSEWLRSMAANYFRWMLLYAGKHSSDDAEVIDEDEAGKKGCAVFRTPQSIAKTVLHKFVGYLETQASERIWKPRCSATIAWEQTQGISVKDKTSKYTGPRGDWSQGYGYITRDGFCPCGASLATHEDRTCPGATKNPRAADERLAATIVAQSQVPDRTVTDGWFTEEFGL